LVAPDGRFWRTGAASPTTGQCLNGGLGWLEVECVSCKTRASLPLDAIRRPRDTPLWKLEASLKCRSCRKGRHAPPVPMETGFFRGHGVAETAHRATQTNG
jgi:hypothetical protein